MQNQIDLFLAHLSSERGLSLKTVEAYGSDLKHLKAHAAMHHLENWSQLTVDLVAEFLQSALDVRSQTTAVRYLSAVRTFCGYLLAEGIIAQNVALQVDRPRLQRRAVLAFQKQDVARILSTFSGGPRDRAILELIYATGLKAAELTALDVADVDLVEQIITIGDRRGVVRFLPLPDSLSAALRSYLVTRRPASGKTKPTLALFLNYAGRRISRQMVWAAVRRAAAAAGIQGTPTMLRSTYAVELLEADVASGDVQAFMGLSDSSVAQPYLNAAKARRAGNAA